MIAKHLSMNIHKIHTQIINGNVKENIIFQIKDNGK